MNNDAVPNEPAAAERPSSERPANELTRSTLRPGSPESPQRSGSQPAASSATPELTGEEEQPPVTHEQIALGAYYRAERRGFEPGRELEDWLEAERELVETVTNLARGVR